MTERTYIRCDWCGDDPLYVADHDDEWGVQIRDYTQKGRRVV